MSEKGLNIVTHSHPRDRDIAYMDVGT